MRIHGRIVTPLSVQEVISCGQPTDGVFGCRGGYFTSTYNYAKVNGTGGAIMYPYSSQALEDGVTNACNHTLLGTSSFKSSKVIINKAMNIPYRDCRAVVNVLKSQALAVSISTSGFQFYQSGIYHGQVG
jgi:hypothetical protein